jgi:hypothetical protein
MWEQRLENQRFYRLLSDPVDSEKHAGKRGVSSESVRSSFRHNARGKGNVQAWMDEIATHAIGQVPVYRNWLN